MHAIIRFYVGHESKVGATRQQVAGAIDRLAAACAITWGGCTRTIGRGTFLGNLGTYHEDCTIVETLAEVKCERDRLDVRQTSRALARECAKDAGQESVLVTVQPVDAEFVSAD